MLCLGQAVPRQAHLTKWPAPPRKIKSAYPPETCRCNSTNLHAEGKSHRRKVGGLTCRRSTTARLLVSNMLIGTAGTAGAQGATYQYQLHAEGKPHRRKVGGLTCHRSTTARLLISSMLVGINSDKPFLASSC